VISRPVCGKTKKQDKHRADGNQSHSQVWQGYRGRSIQPSTQARKKRQRHGLIRHGMELRIQRFEEVSLLHKKGAAIGTRVSVPRQFGIKKLSARGKSFQNLFLAMFAVHSSFSAKAFLA
jgi:hypothetical protein